MEDDGLLSLLPDRLDLPRGRSALSKSDVEASRRGRIMQAALDEVAESGYAAATVAAITKRAHVSRSSFYDAFADKEEAFAAAHWHASDLALTRVWEPALTRPDLEFDERIATVLASYLHVLETARSFTVCFFVEILAAGAQPATRRGPRPRRRRPADPGDRHGRHAPTVTQATSRHARGGGGTVVLAVYFCP